MSRIKIYNLRIVPKSPIFNDVINFKYQIIKKYGIQPLSKSLPHITLGAFLMNTDYEDILVRELSKLSEIPNFSLKVNGFNIFEGNSDVLYLKVLTTTEIEELLKKFKIIWIRDLHRKLNSINMPNNLHITISKFQNRQMLKESLALFEDINYNQTINVDSLVLTSRDEYKTWDWEYNIPLKQKANYA